MRRVMLWMLLGALGGGLTVGACGDDDGGGDDAEICGNNLDDDGDGLTDCLDPDCTNDPYCAGCDYDGTCDPGEDAANCPNDCDAVCGNGTCEIGENHSACPEDCPAICGNGICETGEDSQSCAEDCGAGDCSTPPDLLSQTSCDASEACDIMDNEGTLGCREEGTTAHYGTCASATDCQAGDSCISLDGENLFCAPFCDPNTEACPGDGTCYITLGSVEGVMACGIIALDDCDLVDYGAGCDAGEGCYLADNQGGTICTTEGTVAPGDPCEYANDCQAGYGCVGDGTTNTCEQLCKDTVDCDSGTCQGIGQVMPGHADVGVCAE